MAKTEAFGDIEVVPLSDVGRRFSHSRRVRMGDAGPNGRLRTDAAARFLQDVAQDDTRDADLDPLTSWIVRRTVLVGDRWPRRGDMVDVTTFGSGVGRSWAERRTIIENADARVDGVALWIHLDAATGMPTRLRPEFHDTYDEVIGGRRVSTRLRLGDVPDGLDPRPWSYRSTDIDVFNHVNNAATWAVVEEELCKRRLKPRYAELEYIHPIAPDAACEVRVRQTDNADTTSTLELWVSIDDITVASARVHSLPTTRS